MGPETNVDVGNMAAEVKDIVQGQNHRLRAKVEQLQREMSSLNKEAKEAQAAKDKLAKLERSLQV